MWRRAWRWHVGEGYSLLSPPGKMERRRTFLFFSSGAIGSGLEAWFNNEESRELLFILKGGAGGFSSISTLSDIFSSTHNVLWEREKESGGERGSVVKTLGVSEAGREINHPGSNYAHSPVMFSTLFCLTFQNPKIKTEYNSCTTSTITWLSKLSFVHVDV